MSEFEDEELKFTNKKYSINSKCGIFKSSYDSIL